MNGSDSHPVRFYPPRYDAWYDRPLGRYCFAREVPAVVRALQPHTDQLYVEVGAGSGRFADAVAETGARVVATDPDPRMAAFARAVRRGTPELWAAAPGQALPFPDDTFHGAFTVTALCFAPAHQAMVREMARVVRPGGRVVLGELNALAPWQLWRRLKAIRPGSPYRFAHFHTVRGLTALLREAGLRDVRHETLLYWMPWSGPALRVAPLVERIGQRLAPGLGSFVVIHGTVPERP